MEPRLDACGGKRQGAESVIGARVLGSHRCARKHWEALARAVRRHEHCAAAAHFTYSRGKSCAPPGSSVVCPTPASLGARSRIRGQKALRTSGSERSQGSPLNVTSVPRRRAQEGGCTVPLCKSRSRTRCRALCPQTVPGPGHPPCSSCRVRSLRCRFRCWLRAREEGDTPRVCQPVSFAARIRCECVQYAPRGCAVAPQHPGFADITDRAALGAALGTSADFTERFHWKLRRRVVQASTASALFGMTHTHTAA